MTSKLTIYIADAMLHKAADNIIDITRKMTGDTSTEVDVQVTSLGGINYPTWTTTYSIPTSNNSTINSGTFFNNSNITTGTFSSGTTTTTSGTQWTGTQWVGYSNPAPLTPDQIPTKDLFEQMLIASIKQLNEAYNLGRVHGYIEGKKSGEDGVHEQVKGAMDVDPLIYEEDSSKPVPAV